MTFFTTTTTLDMSVSLPVLRTTPWPTTRPAAYLKAFGRYNRASADHALIAPLFARRAAATARSASRSVWKLVAAGTLDWTSRNLNSASVRPTMARDRMPPQAFFSG